MTGTATTRLTNQPGRTIVSARGNHFVVDSPAPLGGPNEELTPIDLLLGARATCGTFVCESVAQERGIPLHGVTVTAAGDFDPRGLCGAKEINPRMQGFRVRLVLSGPSEEQGAALAEAFRQRCPVYTTFVRAAPIELEVEVQPG
mgnify:CR=1 FL=1